MSGTISRTFMQSKEYEASVGVDGELLIGSLPQKQMKILVGWLAFHEEEVYAAWELAVQGKHFDEISGDSP